MKNVPDSVEVNSMVYPALCEIFREYCQPPPPPTAKMMEFMGMKVEVSEEIPINEIHIKQGNRVVDVIYIKVH